MKEAPMGRSGELRLATFNICSGRDPATGAVDPALLTAAIRELNADVLALQEVDCAQPRSAHRDQAADAAQAMRCKPGNWRFTAALHGTPGERWETVDGHRDVDGQAGLDGQAGVDPQAGVDRPADIGRPLDLIAAPEPVRASDLAGSPTRTRRPNGDARSVPAGRLTNAPTRVKRGVQPGINSAPDPPGRWDSPPSRRPAYGIALLSRLPVLAWTEIRLAPPPVPIRSPVVAGTTGGPGGPGGKSRLMLLEDEPRVALVAVLKTSKGQLSVVCTHLSFVPGWNVRQLRRLHHELREYPRPLVVAGDLNLPGRVPALITGWQPRARARTFPAPEPRTQLDHVLTDGLTGTLSERTAAQAVQLQISDHRALVVELAL